MSAMQQSLAEQTPKNCFDSLYAAHNDVLNRVAWMLCGDPDLARDLVQETWIRAWRAADSLQQFAAGKAWLITILKREYARLFERKRLDLVDIDDHANDLGHDAAPDQRIYLDQLLGRLSDDEREPLLMQLAEGRSTAEIADEYGVSRNAMTIRLHRIKKRLQAV
ncbi:sigma-70 family RNA polymerase sigma factor [Thiosocius teredinicola]|uniref:sigma-70 family RNA polymerase sigma factor n=1 Tax=Thiosocius teredinicola TaxID=1973002 RepID=UPI00099128D7